MVTIKERLEYIQHLIDEAIAYWSKSDMDDAAGSLEEAISEAQRAVGEIDELIDDGKP